MTESELMKALSDVIFDLKEEMEETKKRHVTCTEIAHFLDVSPANVYKMANGGGFPSIKTILKVLENAGYRVIIRKKVEKP